RTLIADIASDARKSAMVEALVRYTWRTDSQLVAEGVETNAQANELIRLGCSAAQGYLYAPAVRITELGSVIRDLGA
ncbi:MAG: EAL domain-containing protein, partial [Actinomycetota bacterium]